MSTEEQRLKQCNLKVALSQKYTIRGRWLGRSGRLLDMPQRLSCAEGNDGKISSGCMHQLLKMHKTSGFRVKMRCFVHISLYDHTYQLVIGTMVISTLRFIARLEEMGLLSP